MRTIFSPPVTGRGWSAFATPAALNRRSAETLLYGIRDLVETLAALVPLRGKQVQLLALGAQMVRAESDETDRLKR